MSLYDDLGVGRDATFEEIRSAYRKRVMTCHPDKGGDREEFERIQNAHDVLADPERRAKYDETGDIGGGPDNHFSELSSIIVTAFDHVVIQVGVKFREQDLIAQTCAALRQHRQSVAAAMASAAAEKTKAEEMESRLKFAGSGPDIIGGALRQRVRSHENAVRTAERKIELIDEAIAYLGSYGFQLTGAQLAQPTRQPVARPVTIRPTTQRPTTSGPAPAGPKAAPQTPPIDYDSVSFEGFADDD